MSTLTKKVIGFGTATLAASAVGAFMAAAPAQALVLSGSVSIDGPAEFNSSDPFPATDTIVFEDEIITGGTGSFFTKYSPFPTGVEVADLTLTQAAGTQYTYDDVPSFITFNDGLKFNLDEGEATRQFLGSFGGNNFILNLSQINGTFVDASGSQVAKGVLTAQSAGAKNFSIDLTVVDVPEPGTMLGLGVVAGSLALTRAGKKNKA